jgi:hypothetical protein
LVRDNNGRLLLSLNYMKTRGWKSADTLTSAKRDLLAGGFIYETVMGHMPNKASWYAVTWYALDRHSGYDAGAYEGFMRGAYAGYVPLKSLPTREELYDKWRPAGAVSQAKPTNENATLRPPAGIESALIVPPAGIEEEPPIPPAGPIDPVLPPLPIPPDGNHLDMPSVGDCVTATDAGELTRHRDCELQIGVNAFFDETTGELVPIPKPSRKNRNAADAWVKAAITSRVSI